jgi:hypothetical protein
MFVNDTLLEIKMPYNELVTPNALAMILNILLQLTVLAHNSKPICMIYV